MRIIAGLDAALRAGTRASSKLRALSPRRRPPPANPALRAGLAGRKMAASGGSALPAFRGRWAWNSPACADVAFSPPRTASCRADEHIWIVQANVYRVQTDGACRAEQRANLSVLSTSEGLHVSVAFRLSTPAWSMYTILAGKPWSVCHVSVTALRTDKQ